MTAPAKPRSAPKPLPVVSFALSAPRNVFAEVLSRVQHRTGVKVTLPILGGVLVDTTGEVATFTSTDLDQWVVAKAPSITAAGEGRFVIPLKRFSDIVASLPSAAQIVVEIRGETAHLTAGRSKFQMLGLPADEWPSGSHDWTPTLKAEIAGRSFVAALSRVSAHAAVEGRGTTQGALLEAADDGLFLVATTGHTLAREQLAPESTFRAACILPRPSFSTIVKLFAADDVLRIEADANQCRLIGAHSKVALRLVEGPYPPYRNIIKMSPVMSTNVARFELTDAIKRVALCANDIRAVRLRIRESDVDLSASSPDAGRADDAVTAARTIHSGEAGEGRLVAKADLLVAALNSIAADDVVLQFTQSEKALVLRDAASPASLSLVMVMPLRWLTYSGDDEPTTTTTADE